MTKYGILETDVDKDAMNRDVDVYRLSNSYNVNEKITIPTYDELHISASQSSQSSLLNTHTKDAEDIEANIAQKQVEGVESNIVVEVVQKGYILHERVIRPAMVIVSQ